MNEENPKDRTDVAVRQIVRDGKTYVEIEFDPEPESNPEFSDRVSLDSIPEQIRKDINAWRRIPRR